MGFLFTRNQIAGTIDIGGCSTPLDYAKKPFSMPQILLSKKDKGETVIAHFSVNLWDENRCILLGKQHD